MSTENTITDATLRLHENLRHRLDSTIHRKDAMEKLTELYSTFGYEALLAFYENDFMPRFRAASKAVTDDFDQAIALVRKYAPDIRLTKTTKPSPPVAALLKAKSEALRNMPGFPCYPGDIRPTDFRNKLTSLKIEETRKTMEETQKSARIAKAIEICLANGIQVVDGSKVVEIAHQFLRTKAIQEAEEGNDVDHDQCNECSVWHPKDSNRCSCGNVRLEWVEFGDIINGIDVYPSRY